MGCIFVDFAGTVSSLSAFTMTLLLGGSRAPQGLQAGCVVFAGNRYILGWVCTIHTTCSIHASDNSRFIDLKQRIFLAEELVTNCKFWPEFCVLFYKEMHKK
jgi:hypothetical protein